MQRFLFLPVLLIPQPLHAAGAGSADFFLSGVKLFAVTVAVVGIMLLLHYLNRKGMRLFEGRRSGGITIVETRPVGGRKSLCLVEVRGESILLGIGNDRIDLLHHFDKGKARAGIPEGRFESELKQRQDGQQ